MSAEVRASMRSKYYLPTLASIRAHATCCPHSIRDPKRGRRDAWLFRDLVSDHFAPFLIFFRRSALSTS